MSIRLMTLAWELKIPATPKIVLLALCDWANDEGICFPSVARVASRASLSPRQCKRVLHQLADDRWVDVVGMLMNELIKLQSMNAMIAKRDSIQESQAIQSSFRLRAGGY